MDDPEEILREAIQETRLALLDVRELHETVKVILDLRTQAIDAGVSLGETKAQRAMEYLRAARGDLEATLRGLQASQLSPREDETIEQPF